MARKGNKRKLTEVAQESAVTLGESQDELVPQFKKAKLLKKKETQQQKQVIAPKNAKTGITKKKKKNKKKKPEEVVEEKEVVDEAPKSHAEKAHWTNKQRVMVLCSRGIAFRHRHLMEDIKTLMPHHKREPKLERCTTLSVLNEMAEIKHCNKVLLFEGRKKKDLYMWMSNIPNGPSAKFLIENIHTMAELKLTGNCLRGSRPLLSFDTSFSEAPHFKLLKELIVQIFGVPKHHPKSQPFFDHVYTFSVLDGRIWFRNYQILSHDGALAEIGPRFVLNPIKIFSGSFGGVALWENKMYVTPARLRREYILTKKKNLYINKQEQKLQKESTKIEKTYELNPLDTIFQED